MTITIDGPAPQLGLNITDYSGKMNCLSWCTIDSRDVTMNGEHIVEIAPRAGHLPLSAPEFSTGPTLCETAGYPAALFTRDALDYLATQTQLDGSTFTLAAICDIDKILKSPQNIFSLASPQKHIRLMRQGDRFVAKIMGKDIYISDEDWDETGPFLVIMSASDGVLRVRISDTSKVGDVAEVPFENPNSAGCFAIFGAEQIAKTIDSTTPSAPRTWRDPMLDMLLFGHDILAGGPDLPLLDKYFAEIYAGAAHDRTHNV